LLQLVTFLISALDYDFTDMAASIFRLGLGLVRTCLPQSGEVGESQGILRSQGKSGKNQRIKKCQWILHSKVREKSEGQGKSGNLKGCKS